MKKIFMAIVAVLMAAPSFAQYSSGGFNLSESTVYYGIRLGMNISSLSGDYQDMGARTGMNLGGVIGLRVSDSTPVFLESGLYYSGRGAKEGKTSVTMHYMEVPVLIKYGIQIPDVDIAILPYIGPYFSYGLSGDKKYESTSGTTTVIAKRSTYKDYKHADMGFKVGCGAEYNKLYLELGYQFGVLNIAKENPGDLGAHTGSLYVNLGVNF